MKKIQRTFYGKKYNTSKVNETATQAVKRAKALDAVKETKIGKFDVDIFVVLFTFCYYCYFQVFRLEYLKSMKTSIFF